MIHNDLYGVYGSSCQRSTNSQKGPPVCLATEGTDGTLMALLRMPGVPARIEHMAIGKAYTCAKMGCSTAALHDRLQRENISLADFGPPHDFHAGRSSPPGQIGKCSAGYRDKRAFPR